MTLTLANLDENSCIPTYIDEFNRTHSDIRVELLPEMTQEALVALMASDEAPDIIGFGYNSPESMAAKGWLLDMYTLMGDFPREDFLRLETDGALSPEYGFPRRLEAVSAALCSPDIGFGDMGVHYYGMILTYSIPLDTENRQGADCDFTSPEFFELLEAARSMDKAESQSSKKLALSIISGTHGPHNHGKERKPGTLARWLSRRLI